LLGTQIDYEEVSCFAVIRINTFYNEDVIIGRKMDIVAKLKIEARREPHEPIWREAIAEIERLRSAIETTLNNNLHLADGENCTLIDLKRALSE